MDRSLLLAAVLTLSCVHGSGQSQGYPLYANAGQRLPREQVAQLFASMPNGASVGGGSPAFIKTVDGKDVSTLDMVFELLPGCHIVQTASRLIVANEFMTFSGDVGTRTFAFQMRPGNTYVVKVELQQGTGVSAQVLIYAIEQDAAGKELQRISSAKSVDEVRACMSTGRL